MIKECLFDLANTNTDIGDRRKEFVNKYIGRYDESQLFNIMRTPQGLIAEDINIHYFPGTGFRCSNDTTITGRLPMCNIMQNILNKKYNSIV